MVAKCHIGDSTLTSIETTICLVTGCLWIPFTALLGYISYEHWTMKNTLHFLVTFLFCLGALFRLIWLFIAFEANKNNIFSFVINRLSILLQFSALSFLLCMWTRSMPKRMSLRKGELSSNMKNQLSTTTNNNSNSNNDSNDNRSGSALGSSSSFSIACLKDLNWFLLVTLVINLIVWIFFLISIQKSFTSATWYQSTLLVISFLCLFQALSINVIGIRTGLKMYRELEPTFVNDGRVNKFENRKSGIWKLFHVSSYVFTDRSKSTASNKSIYPTSNQNSVKLNIQVKAFRLLLYMSTVLAICFAIRCFCFMYNTLVECTVKDKNARFWLDAILYPLFYYQVPEFFPALIVVNFLASKNSVLKNISKLWSCMFAPCMKKKLQQPLSKLTDLPRPSSEDFSDNNYNVRMSDRSAKTSEGSHGREYGMSKDFGGIIGGGGGGGGVGDGSYRLSGEGDEEYDSEYDVDANIDDAINFLNSNMDEYDIGSIDTITLPPESGNNDAY